MLTPIRSEKKSDQVYAKLRDSIIAGEFQAGDKLPTERELCGLLEVNRSSIREAMKRLEQARLVEVRQGSGCIVLDFKASAGFDLLNDLLLPGGQVNELAIRSIFEFRLFMGQEIARLAARRIQEPELKQLAEIVEQIEGLDTADGGHLQLLDFQFCYTLAQASENLAFLLILNSTKEIYMENKQYFTIMFDEAMGFRRIYRDIYNAVERHDEQTSRRLCGELIERCNSTFFKHSDFFIQEAKA